MEADVARDDELVVALVVRERRQPERLRLEEVTEGLRNPARGLPEALVGHVDAVRLQQILHRALGGRPVERSRLADGGEVGVLGHAPPRVDRLPGGITPETALLMPAE